MRNSILVVATIILIGAVYLGIIYRPTAAARRLLLSSEGRAALAAYVALQDDALNQPQSGVLERGAILGMVASMNDIATQYSPPDTSRSIDQIIQTGRISSIGVQTQTAQDDEGVRLVRVLPNSPASDAGLLAGDLVVEINGRQVLGQSAQEVSRLLRGPVGSSITVRYKRRQIEKNLRMVRRSIQVNVVELLPLPNGFWRIAIYDLFSGLAAIQAREALANPKINNTKGIILDLRDNSGGQIAQATQIADAFLERGSILTTQDRQGNVQVQTSATSATTDYQGPMVVLVNRYTASAAEILAAALQSHGRAQLIGENTLGKGVLNAQVKFEDGSELLLPTMSWKTPDGRDINKVGLTPDVRVSDSRFPDTPTVSVAGFKSGELLDIYAPPDTCGYG
jgi:carboxyl-terminal processing protease